ncbi:rod shape-determining protein MreD [Clostridiales bacterium COT073_COT-073]|nr:rod shape-determining protein MreD [Clostridiales bacterium COT073_COT-073]
MKRIGFIAFLILVVYFLQTGLFTWIAINQIKPNFMIATITLVAFLRGEYYGLAFGAPLGLLTDIFFGPVIGPNFFLYSCIGLLAGKTYYVFSKENFMFPLLVIGLTDVAYNLAIYILGYLFRGNMDFFYFLLHIILPEAVYTILIGAVVYRPFVFINQKLLSIKKNQEESELR